MAASYPTSTKSFSTKLAGDTVAPSHPNEIQDEVVAIENALRTGLAHHLLFVDATYDIGASGATRPRDFWLSRNARLGGTLTVDGVTTLTGAATLTAAAVLNHADSTVKAGASTETAKLAGIINTDSTQAATGANTTDTLLFNYSLPADALNANGRTVRFTAWGTFGATGNSKTVRIKWNNASGVGGDTAVTVTTTSNGGGWRLVATIMRTGSNTQDVSGMGVGGAVAAAGFIAGTATDNAAITLGVTSQNGSAAANDCVYEGSIVEFLN